MRHRLNDHVIGGGLVAPAQICALRALRLFECHKVPLSVAEELVRTSYYHGSRNPEATAFGKDLDLDMYRNGRMIAAPFRLLDCSRENDGAGTLLLVSTGPAGVPMPVRYLTL